MQLVYDTLPKAQKFLLFLATHLHCTSLVHQRGVACPSQYTFYLASGVSLSRSGRILCFYLFLPATGNLVKVWKLQIVLIVKIILLQFPLNWCNSANVLFSLVVSSVFCFFFFATTGLLLLSIFNVSAACNISHYYYVPFKLLPTTLL